jgi:paraquat-inducible protein A
MFIVTAGSVVGGGSNALEYALATAGRRFIFSLNGRLPSGAHWCPAADGGEGITVFQRGTPQPTKRQLTNCRDCGHLQFIPVLPACATARCIRCRHVLRRTRHDPLVRPLACALAGLALYIAVIALQFSAIEIFGREHAATLVSFPEQLYITGFWELACLVLLFIIILPPIKLLLLALVLLGLRLSRPPYVLRLLFRIYSQIGPWAMIEVFLVGFFVAYTRLVNLATVDVGAAAWGLGGLMLAIVAADVTLDPEAVWQEIEHRCLPPVPAPQPHEMRLIGCPCCGKVCRFNIDGTGRCQRCGGRVWVRKPASLSRTWALLLAASICALGAYAYPVMTVSRLGRGEPMTIIAGMIELAAIGWWPIAIVVFVASILIPLFKLIALASMLVSVHRRSIRALRHRTSVYRFVEAIGRWSMIDIFMVSILTALVQFGFLGTIHPDVGALAFAAVVVLTMLAAYSFDPRLMWDAAEQRTAAPPDSRPAAPLSRVAHSTGFGA